MYSLLICYGREPLTCNVLRAALTSDVAPLTGLSSTKQREGRNYISTHMLYEHSVSTLTHTDMVCSVRYWTVYLPHYIYYLYYPLFPSMFPLPRTRTHANWYLVLVLGTNTGRYLRQ